MSIKKSYDELRPFFAYLKKYFLLEAIVLSLILIGSVCGLAAPYALGKLIDEVIPASNTRLLFLIILIIVGINALRIVVGVSSDYINTWLARHIMADIKQDLFSNLLNLPLQYFEKNKPGEIIQIISLEVDKIQYFLTTGIIRLLNNLFTLLSISIMLCYLNLKLFLIALIVLPIVIFINSQISQRIRVLVQNTGIKEGVLYNFYHERIKNIVLVKVSNTYLFEQNKLSSQIEDLTKLNLQNTKITSLGSNLSSFFVSFSPLLILLIGGYYVINDLMTIGALVAFIQYTNRIIAPTHDFLNLYMDYAKAHESAKRILPYLQVDGSSNDTLLSISGVKEINTISLKDVGFSINEKTILSDINVNFEKGRSYCIVGKNGSGKTTLVKLLAKLYEPSSGTILINDKFILSKISSREWHNILTVVSQNSHILNESIRENLQYGNPNSKDKELWNALQSVNLDTYVNSLPDGLSTLIGDGDKCANPSGGQAQKISLARAFLKKSEIVILDEVTSSFDDYSRKEIMDQVLETFSDKIIICITHHMANAMLFDHILLVENGSLAEFGCPSELMKLNGKFKSLFQHQLFPNL